MTTIRGFEFPDELFYLLEHDAWLRLDADGDATTGITSLGAHISGEFIEFMAKPVGTLVERERALGMLEMSKVIRSARSPVTAIILDVNERVRADPKLINSDPYGEGWLLRVRPTAWQEESRLLVTGTAIPAALESYMAFLAETFGEAAP
jgi:glycine cleavage system H protein